MFTQCPACFNKEGNKDLIAREMIFGTREVFHYKECSKCGSCYIVDKIDDFSRFYPSGYHTEAQKESVLKKWLWKEIYYTNFFEKGIIGKVLREVFYKVHRHYPEPNIGWVGRAHRMIGRQDMSMPIVDLGCGFGYILHQLKGLGFTNLLGVEPHFNNTSNITIEKVSIENFLAHYGNKKKFDIVILSHTFEHFLNQEEVLGGLEEILTDNGIIVLAMPVIGGAFKKFGTNWLSFDAPRHVALLSDSGFRAMVDRTNLIIEDVLHEQTPWELARSELYSWDISFNEIKELAINDIDLAKYQIMANALNKAKSGGSSVTYFLRKKK